MDDEDDIWKLLKILQSNLIDPLTADLTCVICKTILVIAYQGACGCRYCLKCAESHFKINKNCCPGNTKICSKIGIFTKDSIVIDHNTNIKLTKLNVRCPKQECTFTCTIKEMKRHISECRKKLADCPFTKFGCPEVNINLELVMKHLENASYTHSKLLSDHMLEVENESSDFQIKNVEYFKRMEDMTKENFEKLNKESKKNEKYNLDVRKYLAECAQRETEKDKEIKLLNEKLRQTEMKCDQISRTAEENKAIIEQMKQVMQRNQIEFQNMMKKCQLLFDITTDTEYNVQSENRFTIYQKRYDLNQKTKNLELQIMKMNEFMWKIENFANKRKKAASKTSSSTIYSDPFYTHKHGYKMSLRITLDGSETENETYLSVFFCIMKGDFDEMLTWPLRGDIIINLIDQDTGKPYKRKCFNYESTLEEDRHCFDKPGTCDIRAYGNVRFIEMSNIHKNSRVIRNDSIILTCLTRNLS